MVFNKYIVSLDENEHVTTKNLGFPCSYRQLILLDLKIIQQITYLISLSEKQIKTKKKTDKNKKNKTKKKPKCIVSKSIDGD